MSKDYTFLEKLLFGTSKRLSSKQLSVLRSKTILITGATHGIGEELTLRLMTIDCTLFLIGRSEGKLLSFKSDIATVYPIVCGLTKQRELDSLIKQIGTTKIDCFINNAGRSMKKSIYTSKPEDASKVMRLNYNAPTYLIMSLLTNFRKGSMIVNVSSASALLPPTEKWGVYNASKIAVKHWFNSIRAELVNTEIKHVFFPLVNTRMIPEDSTYKRLPKLSTHHAVAIILQLMTSSKKSYKPWWLSGSVLFLQMFNFLWKPISRFVD